MGVDLLKEAKQLCLIKLSRGGNTGKCRPYVVCDYSAVRRSLTWVSLSCNGGEQL